LAFATTSDGVRLALRRTEATGARRGVILLAHAMMASSTYFAKLTAFLASRGLEAWTIDFRGHGGSKPPDARTNGSWCFDDYVRADLPAAIAEVARESGVASEDLCILGHSLGGLVSLAALSTKTVVPAPRRLILVATNLWLERRAIAEVFGLVARTVGRMPARAARIGSEDEPRAYVEQFLRWTHSGRWTSRDGAIDYMAGLGAIRCPTMSVVGDADWMCRPIDARDLAERLGGPLDVRCVGRLRGDAFDADHFSMFTDARMADTLWPELAAFALAR
jgi:alpha-beta hydrolase superfamily lysophospholipase